MATPYLHIRRDEVASTQDLARTLLRDLPVVVIAQHQTEGRGRSGAKWEAATRALAISVALRVDVEETRPLSLMAGVAAVRAFGRIRLKWPNDLMMGADKVGGILVERTSDIVVIGLGANLYWPDRPRGIANVFDHDPGDSSHAEIGALWAAEMMRIVDANGWPHAEYLDACDTLGRVITWDPGGSGRALGVSDDGGLVVESGGAVHVLVSGAVRHVRG